MSDAGRQPACLVFLAAVAVTVGACAPSADDHAERGTFYLEQSQYQAAIIEFRNALQLEPMRGEVRLKLGQAYLHANDGPNALREFVRAADLRPDDNDAQIKAGDPESARVMIARGLEKDPDDPLLLELSRRLQSRN